MNQLDAFLKRIDQLLVATDATDTGDLYEKIVEVHRGAVTLAMAIYGAGRPQVQMLLDAAKQAVSSPRGDMGWKYREFVLPAVRGSLRAMKADVESGMIGNIERRGSGAVLADMLGLAKDALAQGSDGAKNVAAVLAAASYEDTIRRMGETLAGVQGRPDLEDVVTALKSATVLQGASVSTAVGFLRFRNDALHADWAKLKPEVVGSCISFVQHLLLQHFS